MLVRWMTFAIWAAVAASAVHWGLKLWTRSPTVPTAVQVAEASPGARGDLSRLLGAEAPAAAATAAPEPAADARFSLIGVLSPKPARAAGEGVALIAVDGKPAKAYRVGAVVEGQNVLQSVEARGATLGPRGGAALVALRLAPPAPANTAVLPGAANLSGAAGPVPTALPSTPPPGTVQTAPMVAPPALPPTLPYVRAPGQARDAASAR
jgi:general secretion pathway protein C